MHSVGLLVKYQTGPFPSLQPQDQEIGEFYVDQKRRGTDFEALELGKGWSGRD